jgi:hypothetical protein
MSQRPSGYQRQTDDIYETPARLTRVMVPYLRRHALRIWDPANGPTSQLAQVLRAPGFRVIATRRDFLPIGCLPDLRIEAICTNPPYGFGGRLACQFIAHAIELATVMAMLLRIDFDSSKTRVHIFRDCRAFAGKIVPLDRITWFQREGAPGPSDSHAWLIWNRRRRGPPTIGYASRPDRI